MNSKFAVENEAPASQQQRRRTASFTDKPTTDNGCLSVPTRRRRRTTSSCSDGKITYMYIQMELCKRESLREWLQNNKTRDHRRSLDMFKQVPHTRTQQLKA